MNYLALIGEIIIITIAGALVIYHLFGGEQIKKKPSDKGAVNGIGCIISVIIAFVISVIYVYIKYFK